MVHVQQRECIFLVLQLRRRRFTLQQICDVLSAGRWPAPRQGAWYCATVKKIVEQNEHLYAVLPMFLQRRGDTIADADNHGFAPLPPRAAGTGRAGNPHMHHNAVGDSGV